MSSWIALGGEGELRGLATELGIQDLVEWHLRFVSDDEVPSFIESSQLVAFPYRRIDASGVLMLVLPFGKPIVATRVGCFEELLTDEEHALLVPPEDHRALARALERVVTRQEEARAMGLRARHLALDAMSWDRIAERTEALYREMCTSRAA